MNHCLLFNCHTMYFNRPGGPYRIATILRDEGWDVEVVEYLDLWQQKEFEEFCNTNITKNTVWVGFAYFFSYWNPKFNLFIDYIKQKWPHVRVVVGGNGKPKFQYPKVDYYVHGYGEHALLALTASFVGNTPKGGIKLDPKYLGRGMKFISANDYYPAFPMKSLRIKYQDRDFIEPWEYLTCEFSRGCMFECLYCNFPVLGVKGDYTRDAQDYHDHLLENYERWGTTLYYCSDETFNDRTEKIQKFADVTDKLPFKPFFTGFMRADLLVSRKQDWDALVRLGMLGHFYGIESMNHPTAKAIGKGMNPHRLREGLLEVRDYFKSHGQQRYRGCIALVVGLPYETEETFKEGAEWLRNNWQGENIECYPLEIPIDEYTEKFSKLAQDWHKWGYREKPADQYDHISLECNVMHSTTNLNWVNDNMDYDKAKDLATQYLRSIENEDWFKLNPYTLDYASGMGLSLDESLSASRKDLFVRWEEGYGKETLAQARHSIARRYIDKKLNR